MKRLLLTAFIIIASFCTAIAQDRVVATNVVPVENETDKKAAQAQHVKEWQNMLVTELKLTDEQQKEIAELDQAVGKMANAIASNASLTEKEKKEKSMSLRKERNTRFIALLTTEQEVKYKEIIDAKKKKY